MTDTVEALRQITDLFAQADVATIDAEFGRIRDEIIGHEERVRQCYQRIDILKVVREYRCGSPATVQPPQAEIGTWRGRYATERRRNIRAVLLRDGPQKLSFLSRLFQTSVGMIMRDLKSGLCGPVRHIDGARWMAIAESADEATLAADQPGREGG
jgi:hypothetical protein